jgi:hypothetical protein
MHAVLILTGVGCAGLREKLRVGLRHVGCGRTDSIRLGGRAPRRTERCLFER